MYADYDACNLSNNHIQKNVKLTLKLRIEQETEQFFVGNTLMCLLWYSQKSVLLKL